MNKHHPEFRPQKPLTQDDLYQHLAGMDARGPGTGLRTVRELIHRLAEILGCSDAQATSVLGAERRSPALLRPPDPAMLERILSVSGICADVQSALGYDGVHAWLARPNTGLEGRSPLGALSTPDGHRAVQTLIRALLDGAYP